MEVKEKPVKELSEEVKNSYLLTLVELLCSSMLTKDGEAVTCWNVDEAKQIKRKILEIVEKL